MYAKLTRHQVLGLLSGLALRHDALIQHRDGSFTLRCYYPPSNLRRRGDTLQESLVSTLTRYTHAVILRQHHAYRAAYPHVEVRFAFEQRPIQEGE
jgi:hypothetical protein